MKERNKNIHPKLLFSQKSKKNTKRKNFLSTQKLKREQTNKSEANQSRLICWSFLFDTLDSQNRTQHVKAQQQQQSHHS